MSAFFPGELQNLWGWDPITGMLLSKWFHVIDCDVLPGMRIRTSSRENLPPKGIVERPGEQMAGRQGSGRRTPNVGEYWGALIFSGEEIIGNGVTVKVRLCLAG